MHRHCEHISTITYQIKIKHLQQQQRNPTETTKTQQPQMIVKIHFIGVDKSPNVFPNLFSYCIYTQCTYTRTHAHTYQFSSLIGVTSHQIILLRL